MVVKTHRPVGTVPDKVNDACGRLHNRHLEQFAFLQGRGVENVANDLLSARRPSNANPHSSEIPGTEVMRHRLQAVVARKATTLLDLHPADREIDLIMDDYQIGQVGDLEVAERLAHRYSGLVHIGLREERQNSNPINLCLAEQRVVAVPKGRASLGREAFEDSKTDVVAGISILGAGIPQPDHRYPPERRRNLRS